MIFKSTHRVITTLFIFVLSLPLFSCNPSSTQVVSLSSSTAQTGFLVIAPDRGYAGNQKVRKAFRSLDKNRNAQLMFATDERMKPYLIKALATLKADGAKTIIVMPLYLSASHPQLTHFRTMLKKESNQQVTFARPFGGSYLAVELLVQRIRDSNIVDNSLIIAGHGVSSKETSTLMHRDIQRIADQAMEDIGDNKIEVVVWPDGEDRELLEAQNEKAWNWVKNLEDGKKTWQIIPFHMGSNLDGMMNFDSELQRSKPKTMVMTEFTDNESEFYALWMQREANRYIPIKDASVGIVFNAHGSDFHWNQTMRDAVADLSKKIPLEFAFSMADSDDLSKAVKRLEDRGVGVIVIVRVFGMRTSFRHSVERLIGLDIDAPELCLVDEGSRHYGPPPKRLRTTALVVTEGGLADSPFFAKALFDRANKLSSNHGKDTVIVVAHGKGRDEANQQWLKVLESLSKQINEMSDGKFKAVKYQTWREDWKDKRGTRIDSVKQMVIDANKDGGTALIIPARTTGEGPTKRFLGDMKYKAGKGFAPHPLFPKWIEDQKDRGLETLKQTRHVWYPALGAEK